MGRDRALIWVAAEVDAVAAEDCDTLVEADGDADRKWIPVILRS